MFDFNFVSLLLFGLFWLDGLLFTLDSPLLKQSLLYMVSLLLRIAFQVYLVAEKAWVSQIGIYLLHPFMSLPDGLLQLKHLLSVLLKFVQIQRTKRRWLHVSAWTELWEKAHLFNAGISDHASDGTATAALLVQHLKQRGVEVQLGRPNPLLVVSV